MTTTIYHNPACGTSRNTLALIRQSGEEPNVIEYLKNPPTRERLIELLHAMGITTRDLLRKQGTPYDELRLDNPTLTDAQLIDTIMAHPILINRPIVVTPLGVKLCRPSEIVLDLLVKAPSTDLVKEEGAPFLADTRVAGSDPALGQALHSAGLPTDDLEVPGRTFFAYRTLGGALLGFGGYERIGDEALIRSVVVLEPARGRGVGRNLLSLLLRRAFDEGARQAWLLTTSAAPFFQKAGFKEVARKEAPTEILATRQASNLCPANSVLLVKAIGI